MALNPNPFGNVLFYFTKRKIMAEYTEFVIKPGRGTLFTNRKKSDTAPDYKGDLKIIVADLEVGPDGTAEMKISGWLKNTKKGGHLISLSQDGPWQPSGDYVCKPPASDPGALLKKNSKQEIGFDEDSIPF